MTSLGRAALLAVSASVHAALAGWLAAASGAGAPPPIVIDLGSVVVGAEPSAEPASAAVSRAERPASPSPGGGSRALRGPATATRAAEPSAARAVESTTSEPSAATAAEPPKPAEPAKPLPPRAEERPEPAPAPRVAVPEPARGRTAVRLDPGPSQPAGPVAEDSGPSTRAADAAGGGGARAGQPGAAGSAGADSRRVAGGGPRATIAMVSPRDGAGGAPPEYAGYLARFREGVQSALRYPLSARRRGLSGSVELEVVIDAAGRVTAVQVVSSSSHDVLDEAAADAVRRLRPLPLPPHLPARPLVVRLPLVFDLR